jgi:hypothetical protein
VSPDRIDAPEDGWASLKVDELKEQLEARDLPKSGKKDELVARLEEFEAGGEPGATEEVVAPDEPAEQPPAPARRRGSAETSTEQAKKAPAPRPDGELIVRARSR